MQIRTIRSLAGLVALCAFAVASVSISQAQQPRERPLGMSQQQAAEFNKINEEGEALVRQREYAAAIKAFDRACKIYPDSASLQSNIGLAYMGLGDNEAAIKYFRQSLALEPNNASSAFNLANCCLGQGNIKEGRFWLQKCIDSRTADADVITNAKAVLETLKTGQWDLGLQSDKNSDDYFDSLVKTKMVARWPDKQIPLKVFFEDGTSIPHYRPTFNSLFENAFNEWTAATGGKLSWVKVTKKNDADIVCDWKAEPERSLPEGGVTVPDLYTDRPNGTMIFFDHAKITVFTMRPNPVDWGSVPMNDAEVQHMCLHEVGHGLGLLGHSSNGNDCMGLGRGFNSFSTNLTERDKKTIARLYQSYPDTASANTKPNN